MDEIPKENVNENTDESINGTVQLKTVSKEERRVRNPPSLKDRYITYVLNILALRERIKEAFARGPIGNIVAQDVYFDYDIDLTKARRQLSKTVQSMFDFTDGKCQKPPIDVHVMKKRSDVMQLFSHLINTLVEYSKLGTYVTFEVNHWDYLVCDADIMDILGLKIETGTSSDVPQFPSDKFFQAIANRLPEALYDCFLKEKNVREVRKFRAVIEELMEIRVTWDAKGFGIFKDVINNQLTPDQLFELVSQMLLQMKTKYSSNNDCMEMVNSVEKDFLSCYTPEELSSKLSASNRTHDDEQKKTMLIKLQQVIMLESVMEKDRCLNLVSRTNEVSCELQITKNEIINRLTEQKELLDAHGKEVEAKLAKTKKDHETTINLRNDLNAFFNKRQTEYETKIKGYIEEVLAKTKEVSELQQEINRLKKRITELETGKKAKNGKIQNQLKEKASTIERLKKQNAELKAREKDKEDGASEQLETISKITSEQKAKIESLERNINELMVTNQLKSKETELKLESATRHISNQDEQMDLLRREITTHLSSQEAFAKKVESTRQNCELQLENAEEQIRLAEHTARESIRQEYEKEISDLRQQLVAVEMSKLSVENQQYDSQIEKLKNENKKMSEWCKVACGQSNEAKLETAKLRTENQKLGEMLEHLSKDLEKEKNKPQSNMQSMNDVQPKCDNLGATSNILSLTDPQTEALKKCMDVNMKLKKIKNVLLFMDTRVYSENQDVYLELAQLKKIVDFNMNIVKSNYGIITNNRNLTELYQYVEIPSYSSELQSLFRHFQDIERQAAGIEQQLPNQTGRQSEESQFSTLSSSPSLSNLGAQWQSSSTLFQSNMPQWTSGPQLPHVAEWKPSPADWLINIARQSACNQAYNPVQATTTSSLAFSPVQKPSTSSRAYNTVQATSTNRLAFSPVQKPATINQAYNPVQATSTSSFGFSPVQKPSTSSQAHNQDPFMTSLGYSSMQQTAAFSQAYSTANPLSEQEPERLSFPYPPPVLIDASSYDMFASADDNLVGFTLEEGQNDN